MTEPVVAKRVRSAKLLACCLLVGCNHEQPNSTPLPNSGKAASPSNATTGLLHDLVGDDKNIRGMLRGDYVILESGEEVGERRKGSEPLAIEFESHSLPIMPDTERIAKLLMSLRGREVEIEGRVTRITAQGRAGLPLGQAGYTGSIPDHAVYFVTVETCTPVEVSE